MKHSLQFELDPTRFRRLFVLFALGALVLIWAAFGASNYTIRHNLERGLVKTVQSDALMLEDHASRALDAVASQLKFVSAQTSSAALRGTRLAPQAIRGLIFESPMVRSLSLVDPAGRVVASSEDDNIGLVLPADKLPPLPYARAVGVVSFGALFPYRDLHALVAGRTQQDVSLWLASMLVEVGGEAYRWIAVVNSGYFENFWARVDNAHALEIGLFDYRGQRIFTHNPVSDLSDDELTRTLGAALLKQELGVVELGHGQRWKAAYRGSLIHPVVLGVIGDRESLFASERGDERLRLAIAVLASLVVLALTALLYRAYLRYEASVTEMINQSRAMSAHLMVSESDPDGGIVSANAAFLERTGYTESEILGQNHRIFNSGLHTRVFYANLWKTVRAGQIWKGLFRNRDKAGRHYWVNATIVPFTNAWGRVTRYVCLYSDITEAVKLAEELQGERSLRQRLAQVNDVLLTEATTDGLTGVSNRRGMQQFAREAINASNQLGLPLSVLMLDLDHFKRVNDNYGHAVGDIVLKEMTRRWAGEIRSSDLLARLGGEEFCVLLPNTALVHAHALAEKLRNASRATPVALPGGALPGVLKVTVSVGVASSESFDGFDLEQLIHAADEALYRAKRGGRDQVCDAGAD